jgi:hypothetical protein
MAQHIGLRNATQLLEAINAKIAEVEEDPNLDLARREAEAMIESTETLSPHGKDLLREYIRAVLRVEAAPQVR